MTENKNILIVEDESVTALLIEQQLKRLDYRVAGKADSAEEALRLVETAKPDLVLMDIVLHGEMDGIDAAKVINQRYEIPVVYLTANSDATTMGRAKITSPFGYLLKPFDQKDLQVALEMSLYKFAMDQRMKESEKRFRSMVANISDIITMLDRQGVVTYQSESFFRQFGYSQSEVVGQPILNFVHPEDKPLVKAHLAQLASGELPGDSRTQFRHRRPEGDYRWLEAVSNNMLSDSSIEAILVNSRDITERLSAENQLKEALSQKEVLLKEVYHRVKNNLAMVESMLYLQRITTDNDSTKDILRECERRIRSMALVHRNLYQNDELDRMAAEQYFVELVENILSSYSRREELDLQVDVDSVFLDLNSSLPLGLICNELLTNSFKHAFGPENKNPQLRLSLKKQGQDLVLRVQDNGPGFPDPARLTEQTNSLGMNLVNVLVKDVKGQLTFSNSPGATTELIFRPKP